jgi:hypothetical protein
MSMILWAAISGLGAGAILAFFSHLAPWVGAGSFVREPDRIRLAGKAVTRREAHVAGVFAHLVLSGIFGAGYAMLMQYGIVDGRPFSLGLYAVVLTIFVGGVVLPLEGHGLFGVKEDAWFPLDLLLTNIVWVALFAFTMHLWL